MLSLLNIHQSLSKQLANQTFVLASLVVMGSNINADINLTKAVELLSQLTLIKEIRLINTHHSNDYKNLSKNHYTNQGFLILFHQKVLLSDFMIHLKTIEKNCGRIDNECNEVALDMDILAVLADNHWYCIFERLPFKEHELICLSHQCKNHL